MRNSDFYLITFVYFPVVGGEGGASGDGGIPEQGGGQAQHPQCRHQAPRQQHTKNSLKKLTVHFYYSQSNPIFSIPFLRRPVFSCPFLSPPCSFLSPCVLNCNVVSVFLYPVLSFGCPVLSTWHLVSASCSVLLSCSLNWHGVFSSPVSSCLDRLVMLGMLSLLFIQPFFVSCFSRFLFH